MLHDIIVGYEGSLRNGESIIGPASGIKNNFTEYLTCESILDGDTSISRDREAWESVGNSGVGVQGAETEALGDEAGK